MPLVRARRETGAEFQRDRQTKALWILEEVEVALLFILFVFFILKFDSPSCGLSKHALCGNNGFYLDGCKEEESQTRVPFHCCVNAGLSLKYVIDDCFLICNT